MNSHQRKNVWRHWVLDDGGREAAGFKGETGDCVIRAVAIATDRPYREVYDEIGYAMSMDVDSTRGTSPRRGVNNSTVRPYLKSLGWAWTPTMSIGSGYTVHLLADELPLGTLIVSVSKHLCAVIDGIIYDSHDPSRDGTRCVYGYYSAPTREL